MDITALMTILNMRVTFSSAKFNIQCYMTFIKFNRNMSARKGVISGSARIVRTLAWKWGRAVDVNIYNTA
jgi:hypothetical protein